MKMQQQVFETAVWYDYLIAGVVAAIAAGLGSLLANFGFLVLFIGPAVGAGAAEIVRWAVRKRRSRALNYVAAGAFIAGCLPVIVIPLFLGAWFAVFWPLVYAALGAGAVYARLRGISV
jgi:branched-subunit amino acid transport protein